MSWVTWFWYTCQGKLIMMPKAGNFRKWHEKLPNPFPHIDAFWRICSRRLLKTQWQKETLLKTSNSSFCHNVFYFFSNYTYNYRDFPYFSSRHFQSRLLQICCMWECGLNWVIFPNNSSQLFIINKLTIALFLNSRHFRDSKIICYGNR